MPKVKLALVARGSGMDSCFDYLRKQAQTKKAVTPLGLPPRHGDSFTSTGII